MNRIVSHLEARTAARALCDKPDDKNVVILNAYVSQREAASVDLKNMIQVVLEMYGPDGLREMQKIVEGRRWLEVLQRQ